MNVSHWVSTQEDLDPYHLHVHLSTKLERASHQQLKSPHLLISPTHSPCAAVESRNRWGTRSTCCLWKTVSSFLTSQLSMIVHLTPFPPTAQADHHEYSLGVSTTTPSIAELSRTGLVLNSPKHLSLRQYRPGPRPRHHLSSPSLCRCRRPSRSSPILGAGESPRNTITLLRHKATRISLGYASH
jgi:hypothetical protein